MSIVGKEVMVSGQLDNPLDINGQILIPSTEFLGFMKEAYLTVRDLRSIAEACCLKQKALGFLHSTSSTLLECQDEMPDDSGNLLAYAPVTPGELLDATVTAVILASRRDIDTWLTRVRRDTAHYPKKKRLALRKKMLRGFFGMTLAHELTHAFGMDRSFADLRGMSDPEVELATDSAAFVSCDRLLGEASHLGAHYLRERVKEITSQDPTRNTVRLAALDVLKSLRSPGNAGSDARGQATPVR